jgi:heptosyltransferase I
VKSILIIKPSSLGDVVHTLPAVALVRDAFPQAQITWVINPEWAPLLRGNRDVNHVHIFPRGEFRGLGAPKSLLPWVRKTRALKPDLALDFQGLLRSALIGKISGAQQILGMSDGREGSRFFYHKTARVNKRAHAVERYLELAQLAGARLGEPLRFAVPTGDPLPRFDDYPPFIVLHPFSRGRRKSMSARAIVQLCAACSPTRVVVVGRSPAQFDAPENCVNVTNHTTLLQLVWLIRMARFVVTVDSGPSHIAAAVGARMVTIHTWTDPRRVGPYDPDAWVWRNGELRQMRDFPAEGKLKRGRRFRTSDVPAIVQLVNDCCGVT